MRNMRASARHRLEAMDALVRWGGRFCVAFVWAFCAACYWAVWYYVFIPNVMYTAQDPLHVLVLCVFHVLVVLCLYCYYCAITTDPGFVPPGYMPPEMEEGKLVHEPLGDHAQHQAAVGDEGDSHDVEMRLLGPGGDASGEQASSFSKSSKGKERVREDDGSDTGSDEDSSSSDSDSEDGEPKNKARRKKRSKDIEVVEDSNYCRKCASYRPSRAHHCRHCDRCVMRMDHHCPWVNNCVGHNNLKYFFLFLFYGALLGAMFLTLFSFCIYDLFKHSDKYTSEQLWTNGIAVGVIAWVAAALTLNLSAMCFHTFILIIANSTTIERMALRERLWRRGRPSNKKLRHMYDLGPLANLKQVFGSSLLQWPFPTAPETDGFHSPIYPNPNDQFELW